MIIARVRAMKGRIIKLLGKRGRKDMNPTPKKNQPALKLKERNNIPDIEHINPNMRVSSGVNESSIILYGLEINFFLEKILF